MTTTEPHRNDPSYPLHRHQYRVIGQLPGLHPHYARISQPTASGTEDQSVHLLWNSRDHRKGRRPDVESEEPRAFKDLHITWLNFDVGNISWLVGFMFTIGSVAWCINGFFVFLPVIHTHWTANIEAEAWTAWVGSTIFLFGAYFGCLEALNRSHKIDFSGFKRFEHEHSIHRAFDKGFGDSSRLTEKSDSPTSTLRPNTAHTRQVSIFARKQHAYLTPSSSATADTAVASEKTNGDANVDHSDQLHWHWAGHRFREVGFTSNFIQFVGAWIFWISTVTGIPNVIPTTEGALANGVYWLPQVLGGSCFVIGPIMLMLEEQTAWYKPALHKLGWHSAFWNMVGGLGFTLCGAFGFSTNSGVLYQSACSTFWGSFAFLIGSYQQWWEAMNPDLVKIKHIG